jgi:phage baseplate assembly protein W
VQTILDNLQSQLPDVARIFQPSGADVSFGSDLSCADDVTLTFDTVAGDDPMAVAQSAYRRLRTAIGELLDDPDYGCDIDAYLQRGLTPQTLQQLKTDIQAELLTDDRIATVDCQITPTDGANFILTILCTSAQGPFSLTFDLTDAQAALSAIQAGT